MIVNFCGEETIITFSGLQIVIQEKEAKDLAEQIFNYYEGE